MKSGRDFPQSGRDLPESGRELVKSHRDHPESGRDKAKTDRENYESDREFVKLLRKMRVFGRRQAQQAEGSSWCLKARAVATVAGWRVGLQKRRNRIHPTLTGTPQPDGVVELDFSKEGSDGVNIYCQRDGDATFVFLARDTSSPYVDNRPLLVAGKPEVRRYRCRYIIGDQEVGLPSDEVVVTAQP